VKVDGLEVSREHQLLAVHIRKAANKIAAARLVYVDGSASASDFPLSNADTFIPGKEVEVLAGPGRDPVSLFKGLVIQQSLKVREHTAPKLIVECRHKAVKLTVGRRNAYFFDQSDSNIITALLQNAGISNPEVETTSVTHKQMVQYHVTDWDFLLMRAEANGKLVFSHDDTVSVKSPALHGTANVTLQFGATLLEMDAEIDARRQFQAVTGFSWDPAQQDVVEVQATDPGITDPGNLENEALAGVVGLDHFDLQDASLVEAEAQVWADAQWLKSQLSRVCGRIKCEGIGNVNPGDLVNLAGVGERYNGPVLVTGLRHDFDTIQGWKTHIQFGHTEKWLAEENAVATPPAASLLPGVNGLQVGVVVSNEDPEGEDRVRVVLPLVNKGSDGTWARVAAPDAGDNRGFFFRPEVGDEVVVGFFNDDPRQAVILGMLHSSAKPAPLPGSDDNHEKVYQSRAAMKWYLNDDQKVMHWETPAGNKISLSEADKAIVIADQNGNKIEMTQDGITMNSSKAIILKAGAEVKLESGTTLSLKGGADLKLTGTSGAELSSTAITKVKGSLVQIN
jgi:Rhs element Vgr protein